MKKIWRKITDFFDIIWWPIVYTETKYLTPEEFKRVWNENLENMKIR